MSRQTKSDPSSINVYLRRLALPVGVSLAGLSLAALGVFLLVRKLQKAVDDDDADVENYDVVRNRPLFL
jgi:hypothetical protein